MADDHEAMVRRSFERQIGLFSGRDSPFARRSPGPLTWIEPLDREMVVLDVACGAQHAAEQVARQVREVVGIDLTPALLDVGAQRLRANGITNVLLQEGNAERLPFVGESFHVVSAGVHYTISQVQRRR
jgi:ubiquinone/menaquinone biosynthesis C-methylase UbiE